MAAVLDATKLRIFQNEQPAVVPDPDKIQFGKTVTDHMLQIQWTASEGWHTPRIVPYGNLSIDPTAGVFNYAFECFEGMKAYKDAQGRVRLFRPEVNIARLNQSAARVSLPNFDATAFLNLLKEFVAIESRHIPATRGYSLYLRPVLIGTNPGLSVSAPTSALLYVVASPVGSYFQNGLGAITLEAASSSQWVRAWPGGSGSHKVGANYAPCMVAEAGVRQRGSDQVLWLFGEDDLLTEAGTMNLFIVLGRPDGSRELVTPPLDGTILPGVNRDCVLQLARERLEVNGWTVQERSISMRELEAASADGNLEEVFGTGTAAVVSSVKSIRWNGRTIMCGVSAQWEVAAKMRGWIEARQYGEDEHEWSVLVNGPNVKNSD
ncbi:Aminotransferase, class IV [Penicillium griseofulvum]|uniref:Branched-chain-amino-acid aminotransferase n=1 Tax=Penicillium patulum TaxID=5078 RepID=A0A135LQP4_PENPA|nr:Aminotransferase, class IV [Penicillium griseofulvum]KXG51283.1 Aminotransferase, class IV [Penicillium griseofulvum]